MAKQDGVLMPRAEVLAAVSDADAIINQGELIIDSDFLDQAPKLRIVANIARGFDNLDLAAMTAHGVWATNVPDAFAAPLVIVPFLYLR
jgi:lactate dehydrogenase-like 2-hydroxyacid dehydrogenase